jgi:hypothetical protein
MSCNVCGRAAQAGRCEDGAISYPTGDQPCPFRFDYAPPPPAPATYNPLTDPVALRMVAPLPPPTKPEDIAADWSTTEDWSVPGMSTRGLEDLL